MEEKFMNEAVGLSMENVEKGGGPFGAVIVKGGEVIARGVNLVTPTCDPTAHAEITAIRNACKSLQTFNLSGCEIYTSCEPCPMCLSAIYWARINKIYYANTRQEAQEIGFDDSLIYDQIPLDPSKRLIPAIHTPSPKALQAFRLWHTSPTKTEY